LLVKLAEKRTLHVSEKSPRTVDNFSVEFTEFSKESDAPHRSNAHDGVHLNYLKKRWNHLTKKRLMARILRKDVQSIHQSAVYRCFFMQVQKAFYQEYYTER